MNSKSMLVAAGIGGLIMLALTKIPLINCLNCLLCISYWGAGILTIWVYRLVEKDRPGLDIGQGILLGILAGIVAAVLASLVGAVFSGAGALTSLDYIKNVPGVSDQFSSAYGDLVRRAAISGGSVIGGLICNLVIYPLFGAIGGAIATGLIWKK